VSDLITPAKRLPRTHAYRLGPFTVIVTRRFDTSTARPRFTWTGGVVHTATGAVLAAPAFHSTGIGESPHDGPDRHDMFARFLVHALADDPARPHRAAFAEATAALRPAAYRLPADPGLPRTTGYRLGVFALHLTDHGVDRPAGQARSRTWHTLLRRDGVPTEPGPRTYRAHPARDADSLLLFVLGRYTAAADLPHAAGLAAATAPLRIATYRDPAPGPAAIPAGGHPS
jgi:hypothetical protein